MLSTPPPPPTVLDYEGRVDEERRMWEPLVQAERAEAARKAEEERKKREKWARAFPVCTTFAAPDGVRVFRDGSRQYNAKLLAIQADREWCDKHRYVLSPAIVVAEILRFVDTAPVSASVAAPYFEPLYSSISQELRISTRYVHEKNGKGHRVHGFSVNSTGLFYHDVRLQLDNIQMFADEVRRAVDERRFWVPETIKQLADFARDFTRSHHLEVAELMRRKCDDIAMLALLTQDLRARVDLVYRLVEPFRGETKWTRVMVDDLWTYVFSFTIEPLVIPDYQADLLRRVQRALLDTFLLYVDNLYSFGTVPTHMAEEFVLYEIQDADERLAAARPEARIAVRDSTCRLWNSDEFLAAALTGVQTRARLGPLDYLDRVFTRAFDAEVEGSEDDKSKPLSFVTIRESLLSAARQCTRFLTEEFMDQFTRENRLELLLRDVKSIYLGTALTSYAGSLRGGAAATAIEIREAFTRSLAEARIPMERRRPWSVDTGEKYGRVVAKIAWPLSHVVHAPLLQLLGDCRHFMLDLLRCQKIVMDVQSDTSHELSPECIRPLFLLLSELLQMVTVITELFYKQAHHLVDHAFAEVNRSTTVDEAREHADQLHDRLRDLVGSSGMRKVIREVVDSFFNLAEKIQYDLVCSRLRLSTIHEWSQIVDRERSLLVRLGTNMTNNILADLVAMLAIR